MGIDHPSQVPQEWMLQVLSTLDPEHEFFSKAFVPQKSIPKRTVTIDNSDGFYDDLPATKIKKRVQKQAIKRGDHHIRHQLEAMRIDDKPKIRMVNSNGSKIPINMLGRSLYETEGSSDKAMDEG